MTVKLCDFGLADALRAGSLVVAGQFGTPPFMSPEISRDSMAGTPTDVWSLGVCLYTLVIGQFPYVVEKPCKKLMKAAIVSGVPEPSFQCVAQGVELSRQLLDLLRDLLRRNPLERPTAAEALEHRWFSMESGGEQRPQCSLKEAVKSAKRVGAFTVQSGASRPRKSAPDSMDLALQELQRSHRPQDGRHPAGEKGQAGLDDEDRRTSSRDTASTVCGSPSGSSSATTRASSRARSSNSTVRSSPSEDLSSTTRSRARPSTSKVRSPPSKGFVIDCYA
jgi:serine/threonine protein kinase